MVIQAFQRSPNGFFRRSPNGMRNKPAFVPPTITWLGRQAGSSANYFSTAGTTYADFQTNCTTVNAALNASSFNGIGPNSQGAGYTENGSGGNSYAVWAALYGFEVQTSASMVGASTATLTIQPYQTYFANDYIPFTSTTPSPYAANYTLNIVVTNSIPATAGVITSLTPAAQFTFDVLNALGTGSHTISIPASALSGVTGAGDFYIWTWIADFSPMANDPWLDYPSADGHANYLGVQLTGLTVS